MNTDPGLLKNSGLSLDENFSGRGHDVSLDDASGNDLPVHGHDPAALIRVTQGL